MDIQRNPTRAVRIGRATIGAGHPIAVQSMTATHTQDIAATVDQVNALAAAGADIVRIAVDNARDAEYLVEGVAIGEDEVGRVALEAGIVFLEVSVVDLEFDLLALGCIVFGSRGRTSEERQREQGVGHRAVPRTGGHRIR